jgi:hypothetical protein
MACKTSSLSEAPCLFSKRKGASVTGERDKNNRSGLPEKITAIFLSYSLKHILRKDSWIPAFAGMTVCGAGQHITEERDKKRRSIAAPPGKTIE